MRILHVITDLSTGGAEMMLLKLLSAGNREWESHVVSLGGQGTIGPRIVKLGIPVSALGMKSSVLDLFRAPSIRSIARGFQPALIVGWMPHGNLMASLAAFFCSQKPRVIWNIRMSLYSLATLPHSTNLAIRIGCILSRGPAAIVYNSVTGAKQHEAIGYAGARKVIIPNGFDLDIFRPDTGARQEIRAEMGLPADALLVGFIARYHPMKDHAGFFKAAGCVARQHSNAYFLLAGSGVTKDQPALAESLSAAGLQQRVFLLGERSDVPRLTAALDIACSSSIWGEGFSNAIGEAMACGVPCVVTDIGDSGFIIGDTGLIVPPQSPQALADAISRLINAGAAGRRQLGTAARERVQKEFSLETAVLRYQELYARTQNEGFAQ